MRQIIRITCTDLFELLFLPNWQGHLADILQAYQDTLNELGVWEGYLAKDQFLSGGAFGLIDCAFYLILAYMVLYIKDSH